MKYAYALVKINVQRRIDKRHTSMTPTSCVVSNRIYATDSRTQRL